MQDYIVAWTQGLWDHINNFDAATGRQRAGRARAIASPSRDQPNQISLKETKYPAASFTPGQCALLDMPNPHGYTLGERAVVDGDKLRECRGTLTQQRFAEECGTTVTTIQRGENGGRWDDKTFDCIAENISALLKKSVTSEDLKKPQK